VRDLHVDAADFQSAEGLRNAGGFEKSLGYFAPGNATCLVTPRRRPQKDVTRAKKASKQHEENSPRDGDALSSLDQRSLRKRVHREKPACTCVVLRATRATVAPACTSADSIPRFQANATSRPSFLSCFLPGFEEGEQAAKRRMSAGYLRGVICTDEAIPRRNVNYISGRQITCRNEVCLVIILSNAGISIAKIYVP